MRYGIRVLTMTLVALGPAAATATTLDVPGSYPLIFFLRRGAVAPRGARTPPR